MFLKGTFFLIYMEIFYSNGKKIISTSNLEDIDVDKMGAEIRYHRDFAPSGTNANFVKIIDKKNIAIRTYERGVEGETLACGTGSVASAIISYLEKDMHIQLNKHVKW